MLETNYNSNQYYANEFYHACVNGDFELALCMLKMGVNLNVKFENGQNLLHIACMKNFYGLVHLLIKFGCNEYLKDNFGRTSLHYAALNNSTSIVRYLIEKNTFNNNYDTDLLTKDFLNTRDIYGKTALHLACEKNNKEPLMIILSSGLADINLADNELNTPVMLAYFNSHWDLFEILVKSGSQLNSSILRHICTTGNMNAFRILLRYHDPKTLASLIDSGQDDADEQPNSCLYWAIKKSLNLDLIAKLFEIGVKLNKKDLKDMYYDLKLVKANLFASSATDKRINDEKQIYFYYLECFILIIKHYAIDKNLFTYVDVFNMNMDNKELAELLLKINLDDKSNLFNFLLIAYLDVIIDIQACLIEKIDFNMKMRFNYLNALLVYTSQLDLSKKYILRWLERKLLDAKRKTLTSSSSSTAANSKQIAEFKSRTFGIYQDSVRNPWSLQMLCRTKAKTTLNNIDYVLNDKNLIKTLKLSDICVRYLKFEFI